MEICRLSERKLCIHNNIEVKYGSNHIGYFDISTSYRIDEDHRDSLKIIYTDRFITKLSNKYGIKKKFISMSLKSLDIIFENINFNDTKIIYEVQFNDSNWYTKYNRDLKIKQLFS